MGVKEGGSNENFFPFHPLSHSLLIEQTPYTTRLMMGLRVSMASNARHQRVSIYFSPREPFFFFPPAKSATAASRLCYSRPPFRLVYLLLFLPAWTGGSRSWPAAESVRESDSRSVCTLNVYVSLHPIRNGWGKRKDFLGFCFVSRSLLLLLWGRD